MLMNAMSFLGVAVSCYMIAFVDDQTFLTCVGCQTSKGATEQACAYNQIIVHYNLSIHLVSPWQGQGAWRLGGEVFNKFLLVFVKQIQHVFRDSNFGPVD